LEKFAEILTVAEQPALKTEIIQKCTLSSAAFNKYVHTLFQSGMLNAYPAVNLHTPKSSHRQRIIYQTTDKGKEFLKRVNNLLTLLGMP
jgi:predicted transcriptional regulator